MDTYGSSGNAHYFNNLSTKTLCEYWNEQDGSLSWLQDLETALTSRGFTTRCDGAIVSVDYEAEMQARRDVEGR